MSTTQHSNAQANAEHEHRHLGGLKATLHNPNASADAKEDAAKILIEHGVPLSASDKHDPSIPYKHAQAAAEEHEHRVLGGYKATLHNPRASEEAKEEARVKLEQAGVDVGY